MRAGGAVQPQNSGGSWRSVIGDIAKAVSDGVSKMQTGGGSNTDKVLADLAIQSLRDNQIIVRGLIARYAGAPIPPVTTTG